MRCTANPDRRGALLKLVRSTLACMQFFQMELDFGTVSARRQGDFLRLIELCAEALGGPDLSIADIGDLQREMEIACLKPPAGGWTFLHTMQERRGETSHV